MSPSLARRGWLEHPIVDPWGRSFYPRADFQLCSAGPDGVAEDGGGDDLAPGPASWPLRLLEHSNEIAFLPLALSLTGLALVLLRGQRQRRAVRALRGGVLLSLSVGTFLLVEFTLEDLVGDAGMWVLREETWAGPRGVSCALGAAAFVYLYATSLPIARRRV